MRYFDSFEEEVDWTVKQLLKRAWKVDKVEKEKGIVSAVRISAKCDKVVYSMWIDIYTSGNERTWDWNQYIFCDTDLFDCIYRELQKNIDFVQNVDCIIDEYI